MGNPDVISVRDIAKAYGRQQVLRGASFFTKRSELVGIVGENGSGKTTMLKILVGLLKPDAGDVEISGRIGYCPQEPLVFNRLTVHENYRYFARAYGLTDLGLADHLLQSLKFEKYRHTLVGNLSGGTRQKLNLAIALMHNPDVLILDEPYNGFDWETYLYFWQLTEQLMKTGKSILVVSHLVFDRNRFNRIYALEGGAMVCESAT